VIGHLPALDGVLFVAEQLAAQVEKRETSKQSRPQLTVAGNDPILRFESKGTPNDGGFLTHGTYVKAYSALSLQYDHPLINSTIQEHHPIQAEQIFPVDRGHLLSLQHLPVPVQDSDQSLRHMPRSITLALDNRQMTAGSRKLTTDN